MTHCSWCGLSLRESDGNPANHFHCLQAASRAAKKKPGARVSQERNNPQ